MNNHKTCMIELEMYPWLTEPILSRYHISGNPEDMNCQKYSFCCWYISSKKTYLYNAAKDIQNQGVLFGCKKIWKYILPWILWLWGWNHCDPLGCTWEFWLNSSQWTTWPYDVNISIHDIISNWWSIAVVGGPSRKNHAMTLWKYMHPFINAMSEMKSYVVGNFLLNCWK